MVVLQSFDLRLRISLNLSEITEDNEVVLNKGKTKGILPICQ